MNSQDFSSVEFILKINNQVIGTSYVTQIDFNDEGTLDLQGILWFYINELKDQILINLIKTPKKCKFEHNQIEMDPDTKIASSLLIDKKKKKKNQEILFYVKIDYEFSVLLLLNDKLQYALQVTKLDPNVSKKDFIKQILKIYENANPKSPKLISLMCLGTTIDMIQLSEKNAFILIPVNLASSLDSQTTCISSCGTITQELSLVQIINFNNEVFELWVDLTRNVESLLDEIETTANLGETANFAIQFKQQNLLWFDPKMLLSELHFIHNEQIKIIEVGKGNYFRVSVAIGGVEITKAIYKTTTFQDLERLILLYMGKSQISDKATFSYKEKEIIDLTMCVSKIYNNQFIKANISKK